MHRAMYKDRTVLSQGKSPLANAMTEQDFADGDEEEEAADTLPSLSSSSGPSSSSSGHKTSMAPPPLPKLSRKAAKGPDDADYTALSAKDCFEQALEVPVEDQGTWRVYLTSPKPSKQRSTPQQRQPLKATLGAGKSLGGALGAGRSGDASLDSIDLSSVVDDDDDDGGEASTQSQKQDPGSIIFFHHGAGYSALSFALAAREITKTTGGEVGVMALDCRGHGRTQHPSSVSLPLDMSLPRLTQDCVSILTQIYPDEHKRPSLLLAGHSMGGSVVVSLCSALQRRSPPAGQSPNPSSSPSPSPSPSFRVSGVAVLDVVEGTAMEALQGMKTIVHSRPTGFESVERAVRWHLESGQVNNVESARRSVPCLVVANPEYREGEAGNGEGDSDREVVEELKSDGEENNHQPTAPQPLSTQNSAKDRYIWRHDLLGTSPFWPEWFQGLSSRFLSLPSARLLLLAGTDRLDKDLMVGQMQGKYQLTVFQDVGHSLMEDAPERTAKCLVEFWRRNEVLPDKIAGLRKVGT